MTLHGALCCQATSAPSASCQVRARPSSAGGASTARGGRVYDIAPSLLRMSFEDGGQQDPLFVI